jgi:hypothetical protein
MKSVAIIGAGLAGISLANQLGGNYEVTIYEKSSAVGGRMSTRQFQDFQFDHGAQFFTARTKEFGKLIDEAIDQRIVRAWKPKIVTLDTANRNFKREWFETHYVAQPGMSGLCEYLASDLSIKFQSPVTAYYHEKGIWKLFGREEKELGHYDWIINALPSSQLVSLLPSDSRLLKEAQAASYLPCFSLMLGYQSDLQLNFETAIVRNSPISWIAVDSSKPERTGLYSLLVHSDNEWANENIGRDISDIEQELLAALRELLGGNVVHPDYISTHRWLFAKVKSAADTEFLLDSEQKIAACGDWCLGSRVEDAYISGLKLGKQINKLAH